MNFEKLEQSEKIWTQSSTFVVVFQLHKYRMGND